MRCVGLLALAGDLNWDFDSRKARTSPHDNLTKLLRCCPRLEVLLLDGTACPSNASYVHNGASVTMPFARVLVSEC